MKKILFVGLFAMAISAASFAQGGFQQQTPEQRAATLKTSLSLNDDQTTKITAIYNTQKKSTDSLMTALNGDYASMMTKMTPITNATNAKIKAVLTADQATVFQKQVDARAERMKQMMQQGGGAPPKE